MHRAKLRQYVKRQFEFQALGVHQKRKEDPRAHGQPSYYQICGVHKRTKVLLPSLRAGKWRDAQRLIKTNGRPTPRVRSEKSSALDYQWILLPLLETSNT